MVLRYNGYDFAPCTRTQSVSLHPERDSSGRTTKYSVWKLSFSSFIAATGPFPGSTTDSQATAARQALTQDGGVFIYTGRGLGALSINTGTVRDVKWGPKPQVLSFKPLNGAVCQMDWSIELCLPTCGDARFQNAPMEFLYSIAFNLQDGFLTRVISGHLTIPMTRRFPGDVGLSESVDDYWDDIPPPEVPGFRRRYSRSIDESKTTLNFTITDEEMGMNIPPQGCISASFATSTQSTAMGLLKWSTTFNGNYELAKDGEPWMATEAFFETVRAKIANTAAIVNAAEGGPGWPANASSAILPIAANFAEPDAYAQRRRCVFNLGVGFTCPVRDILQASGCWTPMPGSNWKLWVASLNASAFSPTGNAQIGFDVGDDKLVSLCAPQKPGISWDGDMSLESLPFGPNAYRGAPPTKAASFAQMVSRTFKPPTADNSWIDYRTSLFLEVDSGSVLLRLLPTQALDAASDIFGSVNDIAGQAWDAFQGYLPTTPRLSGGGQLVNNSQTPKAIAQRRVPAAVYVYLRGEAKRAGYHIPPPRLANVNGVAAIPACRLDRGEGFEHGAIFNAGPTPIFYAKWNFRYMLPTLPNGALPIPPNPFSGE